MGPYIQPKFWKNIFQNLHWQSSHFRVLIQFFKGAREAASRIAIGTCFGRRLGRYGIATSPDFIERGFSFWKMWKFQRLHIFSHNFKIVIHNAKWMSTQVLINFDHKRHIVGVMLLSALPLVIRGKIFHEQPLSFW